MSPIALGGFPFGGVHRAAGWDPFSAEGRRTATVIIDRSLERGINRVDTAPCYGDDNSEEIIGAGLAGGTTSPWRPSDRRPVRGAVDGKLSGC